LTELEREILDLAIEWIDAKLTVEEALIRQEFVRKIRKLKKERRDQKVKNVNENSAHGYP
jgi:hypothetical protein